MRRRRRRRRYHNPRYVWGQVWDPYTQEWIASEMVVPGHPTRTEELPPHQRERYFIDPDTGAFRSRTQYREEQERAAREYEVARTVVAQQQALQAQAINQMESPQELQQTHIDDINRALLMGTLDVAESGVAVPGRRRPTPTPTPTPTQTPPDVLRRALVEFHIEIETYNMEEDWEAFLEHYDPILADTREHWEAAYRDVGLTFNSAIRPMTDPTFHDQIMEHALDEIANRLGGIETISDGSSIQDKFPVSFGVDTVEEVNDIFGRIESEHGGGDDIIYLNAPYTNASTFVFYPEGVDGPSYSLSGSGTDGDVEDWLLENAVLPGRVMPRRPDAEWELRSFILPATWAALLIERDSLPDDEMARVHAWADRTEPEGEYGIHFVRVGESFSGVDEAYNEENIVAHYIAVVQPLPRPSAELTAEEISRLNEEALQVAEARAEEIDAELARITAERIEAIEGGLEEPPHVGDLVQVLRPPPAFVLPTNIPFSDQRVFVVIDVIPHWHIDDVGRYGEAGRRDGDVDADVRIQELGISDTSTHSFRNLRHVETPTHGDNVDLQRTLQRLRVHDYFENDEDVILGELARGRGATETTRLILSDDIREQFEQLVNILHGIGAEVSVINTDGTHYIGVRLGPNEHLHELRDYAALRVLDNLPQNLPNDNAADYILVLAARGEL